METKVPLKSELTTLPRNCPEDELLAEIRRVAEIVDRPILTRRDFDRHAKVSSSKLVKKFGGWANVLSAAGLQHRNAGITVSEKMRSQVARTLTNSQLLDDLRRIAGRLHRNYLRIEDLRHSDSINEGVLRRRFGSWPAALESAGLRVSPNYNRKYSTEELFENLLNVWTHYGRAPRNREMDGPPSAISGGTYENRYGGWRKALEAFVEAVNQPDAPARPPALSDAPRIMASGEVSSQAVAPEDRREIPLGLRYRTLVRDSFRCTRCGASPATDLGCRLHVDHLKPFSKGGRTVFDNLQTLCESCNLGKGDRHSL